jgi:hypothetical protein
LICKHAAEDGAIRFLINKPARKYATDNAVLGIPVYDDAKNVT